MEAVRFLADRSGLQVPENDVDRGLSSLRTKVLEINRETARFFHRQLMPAGGKSRVGLFDGPGVIVTYH